MRASRERGRCVQRSASPSKDALVVTHTHQTQHTLSASKLARLLRRHVVARLRVPAVDKPARRRVEVDDRHAHVVPFGVIKVCVCVASACVLSCERVCVQSAAAAAAAAAASGSDDKGEAASSPSPSSSSSSSSFTLDAPHPVLGTRLRVPLGKPLTKEGEEATVAVAFSTTARGTALQWLPPEATASRRFGFLFSQCQAIHARSFLPCQDTPGAKVTYDARVEVPAGLVPRMSALQDAGEPEDVVGGGGGGNGKNKKRFSFEQPVPLSPYLFALAVGELEKRDLSPRCAVYAEPSVVDAAAHEFAETEEFLAAVEKASLRPFRWHRADLLVLPKSFPYGGMESIPTIFVTPTLIVGDRSQSVKKKT